MSGQAIINLKNKEIELQKRKRELYVKFTEECNLIIDEFVDNLLQFQKERAGT